MNALPLSCILITVYFILLFFWDRVSRSPGCPWTPVLPASGSVLGSQVPPTTPGEVCCDKIPSNFRNFVHTSKGFSPSWGGDGGRRVARKQKKTAGSFLSLFYSTPAPSLWPNTAHIILNTNASLFGNSLICVPGGTWLYYSRCFSIQISKIKNYRV